MKNKETRVKIGDRAFYFTLKDAMGQNWHLHHKRGRIVVLLFYPGDETLVCTKQLCSMRDNWSKYLRTGAEIVAISPQSEEQHRKFAEHHSLPMPLLVDDGRLITRIYGKHRWMPIWATRAVVIIDAKGIVRYQKIMVRALRPTDEEVLTAIYMAQYDVLVNKRKRHAPKIHTGLKTFS